MFFGLRSFQKILYILMMLLMLTSCKKNKLPIPNPAPELKGPSDFKVTVVSRDANYAVINWTESKGTGIKYEVELEGNHSKNITARDLELKGLLSNKSYLGKVTAYDVNGKSFSVAFEVPLLNLQIFTFINNYLSPSWARGATDGSGLTFWKASASHLRLIPAISGDTIFVSEPNAIAALNKETFALIWKKNWQYMGFSELSMLSYKGKLVLPAEDKLHVVNSSNGNTIWTLNEKNYTQPCVSKGALYVSSKNILSVYDLSTGALKWKFEASNDIGAPLTKNGTVYFVGSDGIFYALNSENGNLKWKNSFTGTTRISIFAHRPSVMGNRVYFLYAVNLDKYMPSLYARAVDIISGTTIWTVKVGDTSGGYLVPNENLGVFVGANGSAYQLEAETGKVVGGFSYSVYPFTVTDTQIYHQYYLSWSSLVVKTFSRNITHSMFLTPNGEGEWACPVVVVKDNKSYYPAESAMNWIE